MLLIRESKHEIGEKFEKLRFSPRRDRWRRKIDHSACPALFARLSCHELIEPSPPKLPCPCVILPREIGQRLSLSVELCQRKGVERKLPRVVSARDISLKRLPGEVVHLLDSFWCQLRINSFCQAGSIDELLQSLQARMAEPHTRTLTNAREQIQPGLWEVCWHHFPVRCFSHATPFGIPSSIIES